MYPNSWPKQIANDPVLSSDDVVLKLIGGGDSRLDLDAHTKLNRYGCAAYPQPFSCSFASSTASSISERALHGAHYAFSTWQAEAKRFGIEAALERRLSILRKSLSELLDLRSRPDIIFSPSGTDSQLHALGLVRAVAGSPLITIIVGADETGRGTSFAASGRHFDSNTANGEVVRKGSVIRDLNGVSEAAPIHVNGPSGPYTLAAIDESVMEAIAIAQSKGLKVLLLAMNCSKLGRRYPSDDCLEVIRRMPNKVQIVIDACQMRLSCSRINHHISCGDMVVVTGSKFFTGPAFSGALLVPREISDALKDPADLALALNTYCRQQDWPSRVNNIRNAFPQGSNVGAWLRWEAALAEMRAYFEVPVSFRIGAMNIFKTSVEAVFSSRTFNIFGTNDCLPQSDMDDEFSARTIFPLSGERNSKPIQQEQAEILYKKLNQNITVSSHPNVTQDERELASRLFHIGQPVLLQTCEGQAALLRISTDSRFVVEAWASIKPTELKRKIPLSGQYDETCLANLESLADKLDLLNRLNLTGSTPTSKSRVLS